MLFSGDTQRICIFGVIMSRCSSGVKGEKWRSEKGHNVWPLVSCCQWTKPVRWFDEGIFALSTAAIDYPLSKRLIVPCLENGNRKIKVVSFPQIFALVLLECIFLGRHVKSFSIKLLFATGKKRFWLFRVHNLKTANQVDTGGEYFRCLICLSQRDSDSSVISHLCSREDQANKSRVADVRWSAVASCRLPGRKRIRNINDGNSEKSRQHWIYKWLEKVLSWK